MKKKGFDYMAKDKKVELKRVNMNLTLHIVEKVEDYANDLGLNVTSAYIVLLNQALEQKQMLSQMPMLMSMYNDMKQMQSENDNEEK